LKTKVSYSISFTHQPIENDGTSYRFGFELDTFYHTFCIHFVLFSINIHKQIDYAYQHGGSK